MAHPENTTFRHRHNQDGTFDSICSDCFLTIASANEEQKLYLLERIHECDPVRIYEIATGTWPPFLPSAA